MIRLIVPGSVDAKKQYLIYFSSVRFLQIYGKMLVNGSGQTIHYIEKELFISLNLKGWSEAEGKWRQKSVWFSSHASRAYGKPKIEKLFRNTGIYFEKLLEDIKEYSRRWLSTKLINMKVNITQWNITCLATQSHKFVLLVWL